MKRRLASLILLILMASLSYEPIFVYSETSQNGSSLAEINELNKKIVENREKVKQLEQSIETYKKKADQVKLESQSLANQIAILDNHVAQVELDIEVTEDRHWD
jgi:septal ring factor EnvC (AmiA/AmiB activator)